MADGDEGERLRRRLTEGLLARPGLCDDAALQRDMLAIASGYAEMLHMQRATEQSAMQAKSELDGMLKSEHQRRIDANLAAWNEHALETALSHGATLDAYMPYLIEHAPPSSRADLEKRCIPGSLEGRREAAMHVTGSVIGGVLDVLDPDRKLRRSGRSAKYTIPQAFDPAGRYGRLEEIQREIGEYLKGISRPKRSRAVPRRSPTR